ncbi:hydrogenase maturation nickel metallochaperone HypA [Halostella sp. JP-L12]|uniref:hydrogenase maturation nickel metallochaperone HypA n=1 Tax=Halostella TaxID=1843185 RepID=UPI0013CEC12E|nr:MULTISPECIES: hydrogenase maturation nickel metallochaperone HypA [Halostella]NHN49068.1 hydrogenase maturation nickel metallochaperone HypA [Halostella sp. JP-L12]
MFRPGNEMGVLKRLRDTIRDSPAKRYECFHCDGTYDTSYRVCPSCGGPRLERID